jgi:uncharacterized membrane protein
MVRAQISQRRRRSPMTELIAIAYPDTTTALAAMNEVHKLESDLVIQAHEVAVIICDKDGKYKTTTNHHSVGQGAAWGMFWGLLFGCLFFVPILGIAVGAGLGGLFAKIEKSGIDQEFINQIRGRLKPGTSALFMVIEKATPDKALAALSIYGGTVIKSSLSKETEQNIQEALHGDS